MDEQRHDEPSFQDPLWHLTAMVGAERHYAKAWRAWRGASRWLRSELAVAPGIVAMAWLLTDNRRRQKR